MEGAEKTCETPGYKGDCTMEMPRRPRKSKLKEAMKNASEDGKTVSAPLQGAEAAKPGIYVYVYGSVCMCSCLM